MNKTVCQVMHSILSLDLNPFFFFLSVQVCTMYVNSLLKTQRGRGNGRTGQWYSFFRALVHFSLCWLYTRYKVSLILSHCTNHKVKSSNTSHLEAHSGFFRLLMKRILMLLYCDLLAKYFWIRNELYYLRLYSSHKKLIICSYRSAW